MPARPFKGMHHSQLGSSPLGWDLQEIIFSAIFFPWTFIIELGFGISSIPIFNFT